MTRILEGKIALITGAASGIGRAAVLAFAREGARVVAVDVDEALGETAVGLARAAGGEAAFIRADLLVPADIARMAAFAKERFGGLDVAFNNAGHMGGKTDALACTEEEWDLVMGLNLTAVRRCMQAEIPLMLERGGGAIVNTSSGQGLFASPRMAAYVTSKHALVGLTRSVAVDFGPRNIRANTLHPGATMTPMLEASAKAGNRTVDEMATNIPLRRLATAEDQAEAALFLCSDRAASITGHTLVVDGGQAARR